MTTTARTQVRTAALLLAAASAPTACDKGNGVQQLTATAPAARIKFFNYGLGAPGVNFYANDTKLTAIGSATGSESVLGTAYGAAGSGGFYSSVAPGQYTFTGRVAAAADKGLAVASLPATLSDGRAYSFYMSGVYSAAAKKADAFVVEDAYPDSVAPTSAAVRFVNAVPNAGTLTLYVAPNGAPVAAEIGGAAYKGASLFVILPAGAYDLSVRAAGAAANTATKTGVAFDGGRVYTVSARGDVTSAIAANKPTIDNTPNR